MCHKPIEQRKFDHQLTLHHRKPKSIGGARRDERNISMLPRIQHIAWHTLFGNNTAVVISKMINEKYLDPDYEFVCIRRGGETSK